MPLPQGPPGDHPIVLSVNGADHTLTCEVDATLLETLRDGLGLTGAKYGCGEGRCGACVVLLNGRPTPACITPTLTAAAVAITTVEGLATGDTLHPVQQAFLDTGALQCGYCTPGMVVAAVALLRDTPSPSRQQITKAMQAHVCRCGVYGRVVAAIQLAAERIGARSSAGRAADGATA